MKLEEILARWRLREQNKQAGIEMWNAMAAGFSQDELPTFANNRFLQLLQKHQMITADALVLDVGCGTGKYSLALAGHCQKIIGIDFSPAMIASARKKAAEKKLKNVEFYCLDWHEVNLQEKGWEKKFDLVMARNTPAVQSAATLQKLSLAGRGWCVLSKPPRRTDPVSDEIRRLVGIAEKRESSDEDIAYAFSLLWLEGRLPYLDYEEQQWEMQKTLPEAYGMYINRMKTYRRLSLAEEEKIKQYLKSIARDGLVREKVSTVITTFYWHV